MIPLDELQIDSELIKELAQFDEQVNQFRIAGPLDSVALAKLEEHFKASHIYHSAGIEGNRLTLQETNLVLKEGIDIRGKPLQDSIEVRSLGFNHCRFAVYIHFFAFFPSYFLLQSRLSH